MKPAHECPLWRWMPGMRATLRRRAHTGVPAGRKVRLLALDRPRVWVIHNQGRGVRFCDVAQQHTLGEPDREDPNTLGCLVALVREAWGSPRAHALQRSGAVLQMEERTIPHCSPMVPGGGWVVYVYAGEDPREPSHRFTGPTEWDAWAAALWAASERSE